MSKNGTKPPMYGPGAKQGGMFPQSGPEASPLPTVIEVAPATPPETIQITLTIPVLKNIEQLVGFQKDVRHADVQCRNEEQRLGLRILSAGFRAAHVEVGTAHSKTLCERPTDMVLSIFEQVARHFKSMPK